MLMSQSKEGTFPGDLEALLPFSSAWSPGGFPEPVQSRVLGRVSSRACGFSPAPPGASRAPELLLWEQRAKGAQLSSSCPWWQRAPSQPLPAPPGREGGKGKSEEKQGEGDENEYKESTEMSWDRADRDA